MVNMLYAVVGAVFMVGMALFAFMKGGPAERIGAGVYLFAWFASMVMQEMQGFRGMPIGVFLIDVGVLIAFVALAWRARHPWTIWVSGLQLIAVMSHIMILTGARVPLASLYTVTNFTGYLIIACIIVGTFWTWQDRKAAAEHIGRNS
ncbi:hypothetical protein [Brevundimonas sp.]|jgi:hypothetical protein|uniref:hypothetical protein n=1 Tax=Brevundimonas sp. TaxID=1871086 RepID=UPI0037BE9686